MAGEDLRDFIVEWTLEFALFEYTRVVIEDWLPHRKLREGIVSWGEERILEDQGL